MNGDTLSLYDILNRENKGHDEMWNDIPKDDNENQTEKKKHEWKFGVWSDFYSFLSIFTLSRWWLRDIDH